MATYAEMVSQILESPQKSLVFQPLRRPRAKKASSWMKVASKYRDSAGYTWTGRGKTPKWLAQEVATGAKAVFYLIFR